jgi:hypothetical protein
MRTAGDIVLALFYRFCQLLRIGRRRGNEASGRVVDKGFCDEVGGGGRAVEPFARPRGAVQRQQRLRHLDIVGEIRTAFVLLGVAETAAGQRAAGQRPARPRYCEIARGNHAGGVVIGEQPRHCLCGFAGL